jgi:hypothetical protein
MKKTGRRQKISEEEDAEDEIWGENDFNELKEEKRLKRLSESCPVYISFFVGFAFLI